MINNDWDKINQVLTLSIAKYKEDEWNEIFLTKEKFWKEIFVTYDNLEQIEESILSIRGTTGIFISVQV